MELRTYGNGTRLRTDASAPPGSDADADAPSGWPDVDGYAFRQMLRFTPSADVYLAHHRAARGAREVIVVHRLPGAQLAELHRAVGAAVSAAGALDDHPGIAPVEDVGCTRDGRLYVATARPAGRSLGEVIVQEGPLPIRRALHLGLAIAEVVAAAHDAWVMHGRLTPDSVVVVPAPPGQPERVVVLGFGTAAAQDSTLVLGGRSGELSPFVSPERAASGRASLADDVFGLASVLMSMFIGGPPSVVRAPAGGGEMAEPRAAPASEPGRIIQVLRQARSADPGRRYPTAAGRAAALRSISDTVAERAAAERAAAVVRSVVEAPVAPAPPPPAREAAAVATAPPGGRARLTPPNARRVPGRGGPGRRLRGPVAVAGVAGAFAVAWAVRAWQPGALPAFPSPPVEVRRQPAAVAPPRSVPEPRVASVPTRAPAATPVSAPPPDSAARLPGTAQVASTQVASTQEVASTRVPSRVAPRPAPVGQQTVALAAGPASAPGRDGAPVPQRPVAAAAAVPRPSATRAAAAADGGAANARAASAPAGVVASAAGDVIAGRPSNAGAADVTTDATASSRASTDPEAARTEAVERAIGVAAALSRYAAAIEARDLAGLERVYPGMTASQRRAWATFFGSVAGLRAQLAVQEITGAGTTARVRVQGTYEYQNLRPHRAERSPVRFTATLARDASGWRLRAVE